MVQLFNMVWKRIVFGLTRANAAKTRKKGLTFWIKLLITVAATIGR